MLTPWLSNVIPLLTTVVLYQSIFSFIFCDIQLLLGLARVVSANPMVPRIASWVWWRFASSTWSSKVLPIARTLGNAKAQFGLPSGNLTVCYWSHGHWNSEFSHEKWWFSIVMLVYQRLLQFRMEDPQVEFTIWLWLTVCHGKIHHF